MFKMVCYIIVLVIVGVVLNSMINDAVMLGNVLSSNFDANMASIIN